MIITVKVVAGAKSSEVVGMHGEVLKVRIHAPREKGKANEELIRVLAKEMKVPESHIQILSGHTSSLKRVKIIVSSKS